jgi:hypothetical protein
MAEVNLYTFEIPVEPETIDITAKDILLRRQYYCAVPIGAHINQCFKIKDTDVGSVKINNGEPKRLPIQLLAQVRCPLFKCVDCPNR